MFCDKIPSTARDLKSMTHHHVGTTAAANLQESQVSTVLVAVLKIRTLTAAGVGSVYRPMSRAFAIPTEKCWAAVVTVH